MSDWVGPSLYRIQSHKDRKAAVAIKNGDTAEGAGVVLSSKADDKANRWLFVQAGPSASGKEEFLIINQLTGLHLTHTEGAKQAPLTVSRDSPEYYRCRWCIAPTRNGTGAYWIVAASDNKMMLVTEGEETKDNSKLQIWKGTLGSKGTWWYLTLADETIPSANLGKAPAP